MLRPDPWYSSASPPDSGERHLWLAVILTALVDAQSNDPKHRHYAALFLAGFGVQLASELAGIDTRLLPLLLDWIPPAPVAPPIKPSKDHYIQVNGTLVRVVVSARQHGVKPGTMVARLARGWTPRQALALDPRPPRRHALRESIERDCARR